MLQKDVRFIKKINPLNLSISRARNMHKLVCHTTKNADLA